MKVLIDENIPLLKNILERHTVVEAHSGRDITSDKIKNAECLFVRSVTKVNSNLLSGTKVKCLGTATSGTEHIDLEYLKNNNISFRDAKGSNANSVAEYVIYHILKWAREFDIKLNNKIIGIVGYGNIGKLVAKYSNNLGLNILINDSPLYDAGFEFPNYVSHVDYETIIKNSDIITNHVPYISQGKYKTHNLLNENLLDKIKPNSVFIHTSRGGIADEEKLLSIIKNKNIKVVIDVWNNEPDINIDLLKNAYFASPHIAGYSRDGKLRGVKMMIEHFEKFSGIITDKRLLDSEMIEYNPLLDEKYKKPDLVYYKLKSFRKFDFDYENMMSLIEIPFENRGKAFDLLRKNYPLRRECL